MGVRSSMGRVADELLLAVVAQLDAVQHAVNDQRQVLELVFRALHADAVAQVVGAEGGGGFGHVGDGLEHAAVQPVAVIEKIAYPIQVQAQKYPEQDVHLIDQVVHRPGRRHAPIRGIHIEQYAPRPILVKISKQQRQPRAIPGRPPS